MRKLTLLSWLCLMLLFSCGIEARTAKLLEWRNKRSVFPWDGNVDSESPETKAAPRSKTATPWVSRDRRSGEKDSALNQVGDHKYDDGKRKRHALLNEFGPDKSYGGKRKRHALLNEGGHGKYDDGKRKRHALLNEVGHDKYDDGKRKRHALLNEFGPDKSYGGKRKRHALLNEVGQDKYDDGKRKRHALLNEFGPDKRHGGKRKRHALVDRLRLKRGYMWADLTGLRIAAGKDVGRTKRGWSEK